MIKRYWLVAPAGVALALTCAGIRARTAPVIPEPALRQQEVSVTTDIATVDVTGQRQGKFLGAGNVLSFEYQINSPRDPASGLPTGKRQHKPVMFTRHIDAATPQYFSAITTNENLPAVNFHFYHRDNVGKMVEYYRVRLINASISDFHQSTMTAEKDSSTEKLETEQISLTFQKIEVSAPNGGTSATDDWENSNP